MSKVDSQTRVEAEVRTLVDTWQQKVRALDIDGIFAFYDDDVIAFDAVKALQFKGAPAYRKHWEACFEMCPGPMIFELKDLVIEAGDDVAFGYALVRCGGLGEDGKEETHWMRMTAGYRKQAGGWKIVHDHYSAPFDMQTLKILDLQP